MSSKDSVNKLFTEAAQQYDLECLYEKLREAKQMFSPHKRAILTNTDKCYLRGLLLQQSPDDMAKARGVTVGTVRDALSKGLYRYVEVILCKPVGALKNWEDIRNWLEEAGYKKKQISPTLEENKETATEASITPEFLYNLSTAQQNYSTLELQLQLLQHSSNSSQKKQIGDHLKDTGYKSYMEGDFPRTLFYLQWALKFQIDSPAVHYNLASAYEKLSDFSNAYRHYNLAAQSENHAAHAAISNLARLDILAHNPDIAIERITPILDQVTNQILLSTLYKNLAWAYFLQKKTFDSRRTATQSHRIK